MAHGHDTSHGSTVVMDSWFRHTHSERPQEEHGSHVNPLQLGVFFALLTISVVATIIVVSMYYSSHMTTVRMRKMETTLPAGPWLEMREAAETRFDQAAALQNAANAVVERYSSR
ncbi:MAG: hypothetical protein H6815_01845 [Phycisphaeraceae bacterium]|nr:hypothetical protein [Phycisphaerales bacterium]MCB9859171.1 hypothetical protein [Phycisphaeraceae bacterium]